MDRRERALGEHGRVGLGLAGAVVEQVEGDHVVVAGERGRAAVVGGLVVLADDARLAALRGEGVRLDRRVVRRVGIVIIDWNARRVGHLEAGRDALDAAEDRGRALFATVDRQIGNSPSRPLLHSRCC